MLNKIKELISNLKPKLKNAHCVYFEGQTGLCQAKEFEKCNPINCELYTIDELSTILDLQEQLKHKEQECEELKKEINGYKTIIEKIRQEIQEDETCESQECGCDNYEECIECLKNTILNIINEERNDFVQDYKQALDEIEKFMIYEFSGQNQWVKKNVLDIINKAKET